MVTQEGGATVLTRQDETRWFLVGSFNNIAGHLYADAAEQLTKLGGFIRGGCEPFATGDRAHVVKPSSRTDLSTRFARFSMTAMRRFVGQLALGFSRAQKLAGAERRLYTLLSWVMVVVGCILVGALMFKTRTAFGLPMGTGSIEGFRLKLLGWVAVTLISIPTLFYAGMVIVGGSFSACMLLLGKFSLSDARAFALFAQPPVRWLSSAD